MLLLRQVFRFFDLMQLESASTHVAAGLVVGMWLGLTPFLTFHWVLLFACLCTLRMNLPASAISYSFFSSIVGWLDPIFHQWGIFLLTQAPSVRWIWAWLYHAPILPFTHFNNSIVLGSSLFCLAIQLPLFFLSKRWLERYQLSLQEGLRKTNLFRAIMATKLFRLYGEYQQTQS